MLCTATGVTGVTFSLSNMYQVRIRIKGKRYDLGSYPTIEEAEEVYKRARRTGVPERNYLKREINPERIPRGSGTRGRPRHIAHPPPLFLTVAPHACRF